MAISEEIYSNIDRIYQYNSRKIINVQNTYSGNSDLTSDQLFSLSFIIDISNNRIEVPCCINPTQLLLNIPKIRNNMDTAFVNKVYAPLLSSRVWPRHGEYHKEYKSMSPMFKYLSINSNMHGNLFSVLVKDTHYYGGVGYLLYEDYTPLYVFGVSIDTNIFTNNSDTFGITPYLKISPSVFTKDDIASKFVKNKILTAICDNKALGGSVYYGGFFHTRDIIRENNIDIPNPSIYYTQIKIEICDTKDLIATPRVPDGETSDDLLNEFLHNSESLIDTVNLTHNNLVI